MTRRSHIPTWGEDYRRLRTTLENPDIDELKTLEAVALLAALLRLLVSEEQHALPGALAVPGVLRSQRLTISRRWSMLGIHAFPK
jgi:hypothetical protein